MTGTLSVNGKTAALFGTGYHSHQWGNFCYPSAWNNWTWGRQYFGEETFLFFDLAARRGFENGRAMICLWQDGSGKALFSHAGPAKVEVLETFREPASQKICPKASRYLITEGEKTLTCTLTGDRVLNASAARTALSFPKSLLLAAARINPSYCRFRGTGELALTGPETGISRKSFLLYECIFPGNQIV